MTKRVVAFEKREADRPHTESEQRAAQERRRERAHQKKLDERDAEHARELERKDEERRRLHGDWLMGVAIVVLILFAAYSCTDDTPKPNDDRSCQYAGRSEECW
ncbi:hypothetical protein ACFW89_32890 [Streptomyces albidoflavus]